MVWILILILILGPSPTFFLLSAMTLKLLLRNHIPIIEKLEMWRKRSESPPEVIIHFNEKYISLASLVQTYFTLLRIILSTDFWIAFFPSHNTKKNTHLSKLFCSSFLLFLVVMLLIVQWVAIDNIQCLHLNESARCCNHFIW